MNWEKLLSSKRQGSKPTDTTITRSEFEKDYDRIIFSHPFRRLQDKTQVFPLPEEDFVHNRLTHSLEVSSVGRSLGSNVGKHIIERHPELENIVQAEDFGTIVSAAALAHDVGNPPFGHSGEKAISDFFINDDFGKSLKERVTAAQWEDLITFEGNAQGYRILNQKHLGLKLAYATLGAFTKYPRPALVSQKNKDRVSQKKFGYYESESVLFKEMASELALNPDANDKTIWCRHPLAFLVEAADDICYNIIDLEDGCTLGLVSLDETIDLLKGILLDKFSKDKLDKLGSLNEKLGILRAMTINILIQQVVEAFLDNEEEILSGKFDKSLADIIPAANVLEEIKNVSIKKIYQSKVVLEKEVAGFEVMSGLLSSILASVLRVKFLQPSEKDKALSRIVPEEVMNMTNEQNEYNTCRVILDFISGMTDKQALSMYRKIKGISLPSW